VRTIIGYPAPNLMNTGKAHGAALGDEEVAAVKKILGFDPDKTFEVRDEVIEDTRKLVARGKEAHDKWQGDFDAWAQREPDRKKLLVRLLAQKLPDGWDADLTRWEPGSKPLATRAAFGQLLNDVAPKLPELWGGSADLAGSNNTTIEGADSFGPASITTKQYKAQWYGRTLHFGVREHGMGAILSGIVLHGPTRAYGGTFLQFSDYMRPAVQLASLMDIDTIYIWTHDSIGLGEDGPTHQPIEHLGALRAIPSLSLVRPGDPNETAYAWRTIIARGASSGPVGFILTRQGIPVLEGTSAEGVAKGGYVLGGTPTEAPDVVLIGTGSELQLAVAAQKILADKGITATVVSMPCVEWFESQDPDYRDSVLPPGGDREGRGGSRRRTELAQNRRRHRRSGVPRALRRVRRRQDTLPRVRFHPRHRRRRRTTITEQQYQEGTELMTQNPNLAAVSAAGVSVWLDDLSRDRLTSGNLLELINTKSVVGVTTNPSIFQAALSQGHAYDAQVAELAERGTDVDATIRAVTTDDVRQACDVLKPQWDASDGVDGRVSIEVDPRLAHDADKTIQQAIELWKIVDRPDLFIKIPAMEDGLSAITAVIGQGISVNVTLIFPWSAIGSCWTRTSPAWRSPRRPDTTCPRFTPSRRSSSPESTPKSINAWRASAVRQRSRCLARRGWPTPGWPTPPIRKFSSAAIATQRCRATARGRSARCGRRPE
jgi:transketolase C-terminal domain/subunit